MDYESYMYMGDFRNSFRLIIPDISATGTMLYRTTAVCYNGPMNDNDPNGRLMALEMADETVKQHRLTEDTVEKQVDRTLSIIALMVFDMSEADLRDYLTMGGIDLTDFHQFEVAQDYVSWYVAAGVLEVTDLFSFSLVTLDSELALRSQWDDDMIARMDKIKVDGIFFRDMMCPYVTD